MKFDCGLTYASLHKKLTDIRNKAIEDFNQTLIDTYGANSLGDPKKRYLEKLVPVFAWLPKEVGDNDCRWLEKVHKVYRSDGFRRVDKVISMRIRESACIKQVSEPVWQDTNKYRAIKKV